MRTLLVDDEVSARQALREIISDEPDINIVGEASNGLEAVNQIIQLSPDLVFLDIEMPGLNGFEVISSLATLPMIVFVTGYERYALQAFEANAVDYLLKPVTVDRVCKTLVRLRRVLREESPSKDKALQQLVDMLQHYKSTYISRLAVQKAKRVMLVRVGDIIYIKVEDKMVFVYTDSGRFLINKTIIDLKHLLSAEGFFQVNRSTIVNLNHLAEIIPWFSGTYKLKLSNNVELSLSRERLPELKKLIGLSKPN